MLANTMIPLITDKKQVNNPSENNSRNNKKHFIYMFAAIVLASVMTIVCRAELTSEQKKVLSMIRFEHMPADDFTRWHLGLETTITSYKQFKKLSKHDNFISVISSNTGYITYLQNKGLSVISKNIFCLCGGMQQELYGKHPERISFMSLPENLNYINEPEFQRGIEITFTCTYNPSNSELDPWDIKLLTKMTQNLLHRIAINLIAEGLINSPPKNTPLFFFCCCMPNRVEPMRNEAVISGKRLRDVNAYLYFLIAKRLLEITPLTPQDEIIRGLGHLLTTSNQALYKRGMKLFNTINVQ